jgi:hypothetical protein
LNTTAGHKLKQNPCRHIKVSEERAYLEPNVSKTANGSKKYKTNEFTAISTHIRVKGTHKPPLYPKVIKNWSCSI